MTIKQTTLIVLAMAAMHAGATEAPISSVTLYPGSATIERIVQVAPGMRKVEITGLPANFNTETIRVQADAGIQVGQIVSSDRGQADSPSPREAELEAKIQALQDQLTLLDADHKSAGLVVAYLEKLGGGGATERAVPLDPKTMTATLDAIRKGGHDALERMHSDEVRKRALEKQIQALQRDLDKVRTGLREGRTLTIALAARQAGKLNITYLVNNAGWKPTYRASLDSNASSVELERLAIISQKTGEDWSNVSMRLSTGQPRLSPQAPEPSPWLLSYRPPAERNVVPAGMAYAPMAPAPAPVAARSVADKRADDYIAPVIEVQGNFAAEFAVPAQVSLASDGREISVALNRQVLPVKQRVRVAPRLDTSAVVTAEAQRPQGVWLSGPIQLFRDGTYVGAAHWNTQASDRFMFSFGRDTLVRVAVEHRKKQAGEAGFINRDNERLIEDTYAITSFHHQPVDVLVLEPSPVSESDKIKVRAAFKPEPSSKEWDSRRGIVAWEQTLSPGATIRLNMDYAIAYPKEGYVQGLP